MLNWIHSLAAVGLILMIGAAPLCACPYMTAQPATPHKSACCEETPHRPVMPPMQSCPHCPIMNPTHMALDLQAAPLSPPHLIAWAWPIQTMSLVAAPFGFAPAPDESPPGISGDLFHLHCLLTL